MRLPPPPPSDKRFYQHLTKEGQQAVEQCSGPLYDRLVEAILLMNPDCFDNKTEVQTLLNKMVWPPENAEDLFGDFPHIPKIATHLNLDIEGQWIPVFEADPVKYLEVSAARASFKRALIEQFGGVDGFRDLRARCIAGGSTPEEFDQQVRSLAKGSEKRLIRPWWKFW